MMENKKIMWEPLVSAGAILISIFGIMLPLFMHMDNKTDRKIEAMNAQIQTIHNEISTEMKDFHGRLCKIEAERGK